MLSPQFGLDLSDEIEVDMFAGGGGASTGMEQATGRPVAIAINHDADAVGMHEVNHPQTRHFCCDVYEVDPMKATQGRPVGLLHASPDCTHFSQAKGGQPRDKATRSLAWVVHKWAGRLKKAGRPIRVITLENVAQMLQWSPLVARRDKTTGRVIKLVTETVKGKTKTREVVAAPGERVPVQQQFLVPDTTRKGHNWAHFIDGLRALGYTQIQWRVIRNADLGSRSTRERLYLVAKLEGEPPITWPEKDHAKKPQRGQKPWRTAAECIDWSIQGRSIFGRKKDLANATLSRIAHGMRKYVLESGDPFIVPITHQGGVRVHDIREPIRTVTTAQRGEFALADAVLAPAIITNTTGHLGASVTSPLPTATTAGNQMLAAATLVQMGYGERKGQAPRALDIKQALGTVVAGGGKHGLSTAFMVQANGGFNKTHARDLRDPASTITTSGSQQQLAAAHLVQLNNNCASRSLRDPLPTVPAGGEHHGLVQYHLSQEHEDGALRCAAFLMRYHGTGGQWSDLREPMTTITTRDRLALVTVWLKGEPWVVVDITLRMLVPRELYNAQDFPGTYVIDRTASGKRLTKTAQVRMVGNSVSPVPLRRIVELNYRDQQALRRAA